MRKLEERRAKSEIRTDMDGHGQTRMRRWKAAARGILGGMLVVIVSVLLGSLLGGSEGTAVAASYGEAKREHRKIVLSAGSDYTIESPVNILGATHLIADASFAFIPGEKVRAMVALEWITPATVDGTFTLYPWVQFGASEVYGATDVEAFLAVDEIVSETGILSTMGATSLTEYRRAFWIETRGQGVFLGVVTSNLGAATMTIDLD